LYKYFVDGKGPYPDPVSRFQPFGVHNPSQVVDSRAFQWSDQDWIEKKRSDPKQSYKSLVIYELHVGTFTPSGTYRAVENKLPYLKELGVDAIELLPLADFPGSRNWGYDGVCLYAPGLSCYYQISYFSFSTMLWNSR
jgi:maltooligosyltrehalose trehalohydrolase